MQKLIYSQNISCRDFSISPSAHVRFNMMVGPVMGGGGLGPAGIEGGPSWRGDHTFSHSALKYSLEHFVEPSLVKQHPEWTKQKVRTEARREMAISLWESHAFYSKERKREPEIKKRWEVIETAPGVRELSAKWGNQQFTLRELWNHTREFAKREGNPEAYNPKEEQAQLALQDALLKGTATSGVTVLSDVDSFRYAQIWEKSTDGAFYTKVIDLGIIMGRDFSISEAGTLFNHIDQLYGNANKGIEKALSYPLVLIKDGTIQSQDVKTVAYLVGKISSDVTNTMKDASRAVLRDATTAALDIRGSITSNLERRFPEHKKDLTTDKVGRPRVPIFLQFLQGRVDGKYNLFEKNQSKRKSIILLYEQTNGERTHVQIKQAVKQSNRKEIHPVGETRRIALFSTETDIGIGGALFALRSNYQREKVLLKKQKGRSIGQEEVLIKTERKKKKRRRTLEQESVKGMTRKEKRQKRIRREQRFYKQREKKFSGKKEKQMKRNEKSLWEIFFRLARRIRNEKPELHDKEKSKKAKRPESKPPKNIDVLPQATIKKEEKRLIARFAFALVVWLLTSKRFYLSIDESKKIKKERLARREPTLWVLLAIIWHLTAIREQGVMGASRNKYQILQKKKNSKPIKHARLLLPPQGVIFAFQ